MKKGICLGSIPGADMEERFRNAADAGFQGVEVNTLRTQAEREQVKGLSERYGVPVMSVMNSDHWRYPLSDPNAKVVRKSLEGIEQSIETASFLGADTVLVVPAVVTPDVAYEEAYQRSADAIRRVLPLATERGVTLAVENVWNKFLLSPVEFAAYVDGFGSPFVRAYFDVGNILLYGYPHQWIRTLGGRICKVHVKGFDVKAFRFTYLMEGSVEWSRVVSALRAAGYDGYITAELPVDPADPLGRFYQTSADLDTILSMASQER